MNPRLLNIRGITETLHAQLFCSIAKRQHSGILIRITILQSDLPILDADENSVEKQQIASASSGTGKKKYQQ